MSEQPILTAANPSSTASFWAMADNSSCPGTLASHSSRSQWFTMRSKCPVAVPASSIEPTGEPLDGGRLPPGGPPVRVPGPGSIYGESAASSSDSIFNCCRSSSVNRMYCVLFPLLSTRIKE